MANYYIIFISNLVNTFSSVQAGKEFDFTFSTSESSLSDSTISEDDFLIVSIDDIVYYQFKVIDKTEVDIKLKKIFEIEKSIGYTVDEEGIIIEIDKKESDSICSKLFEHLVSETAPSKEIQNNPEVYVKEKYTGRFVFQVLTYLNELDSLNSIKPFFKVNSDPIYTSIKTDDVSLTSIFKTSENKLSKDELTFNDGKPRFFEDVIFFWENKNFYLSTEWTSGKDSRLDLDRFKKLIEKYYPKYSIYEENGSYFFSDKTQGKIKIDQVAFDISSFQNACKNAGLVYTDKLITRFVSSLLTKPFVILTGLSGSGKTKLAQAYVQWLCEDKTQYCIVPVGADWTNREPLLGYVNALNNKEYILPENGALQLLIRANKNQEKPYFLILDEMNLSHIERYFADFLSVMESKDKFKLHSSESNLNLTDGDKFEKSIEVPNVLDWPKNLFVVGTVNIDETTYMFSPKVLDRANVIEFRINETEMDSYLNEAKDVTALNGEGKSMGESFVTIATEKAKANSDTLKTTLNNFFSTLQEVGAEFGYRTASEIQTLFGQIDVVNPDFSEKENEKIDIAIMQKLLPKLHGSRSKLTPILKTLATLCYQNNEDFTLEQKDKVFETVKEDTRTVQNPISLEKITRMYHNVIANGFTSYAEA